MDIKKAKEQITLLHNYIDEIYLDITKDHKKYLKDKEEKLKKVDKLYQEIFNLQVEFNLPPRGARYAPKGDNWDR